MITKKISIMHFYWEFFAGAGYSVESNKEHGEGRSDVVVHDVEQGRVAVFEVKYAKTLNDMSSQCAKALKQNSRIKMYAKDYEDEYEEIDCYGISFYKKGMSGENAGVLEPV